MFRSFCNLEQLSTKLDLFNSKTKFVPEEGDTEFPESGNIPRYRISNSMEILLVGYTWFYNTPINFRMLSVDEKHHLQQN